MPSYDCLETHFPTEMTVNYGKTAVAHMETNPDYTDYVPKKHASTCSDGSWCQYIYIDKE